MILQKSRATEKIVRMIEAENLLVFETDRKFEKPLIKKEVEKVFNVKVKSLRSLTRGNKKIVYVKLKPEFLAIDIATKLGMI